MKPLNFAGFVRLIIDILEEAGVDYMLGGAIAAWHWGQARSTLDVDVVVHLKEDQIDRLSDLLTRHDMLVPPDIIRQNIAETRIDLAIKAIHPFSGYKAELFPLRPGDDLRRSALARRVRVDLSEDLRDVYIHFVEDLILYKLQYYRISRQTKHAQDIGEILRACKALDQDYLNGWIKRLGLTDLWNELKAD